MPTTTLNAAPVTAPGDGPEASFSTLSATVLTAPRNNRVQEDARVKYVLERMAVSERFDRSFKEAALGHWMQVNSILPGDWPFWSRFFEPETSNVAWENIETIMAPIFAKDVVHNVKAKDDQGQVEREMMQLVMGYVLNEHVKYKMAKFYQAQEATFFGNGVERHIVQPKMVRTTRNVPIIAGSEYGIKIGLKRETIQSFEAWPKSRVISRFDCYPAATGATIQEMPYFIERLILPLREVQALGKIAGYQHTEEMEGFFALDRTEGYALGEWSERHFDLYERLAAVGYDVRGGGNEVYGQNAVKYAELLIYSESGPLGYGCDKIMIIGDRKFLLKEMANPHYHGLKPYSEIKFKPRSPQVWQARGIPEQLEDLQGKLNVLTNLSADMMEQQRNPMTLVEHDAGVEDLADLTREPGKRIRVGRVAGILDWKAPNVPPDVWQSMERARLSIAKVGATPDYSRGIAGDSGLGKGTETLGGIQQLLSASNQAKSFTALMAEQGIEDGLNMICADIQQVMTVPQKLKIIGQHKVLMARGFKDWVEVTPEDIQGRWHVEVLGVNRTVDTKTRASLLAQAGQMAQAMPEVAPRIKQQELWREIVEGLGLDSAERFLLTDEEFAKKKAMMDSQPHPPPAVVASMKYKDLPPDAQRQLEKAGGLIPSRVGGASKPEQIGLQNAHKSSENDKKHALESLKGLGGMATKIPRSPGGVPER